MNKVITGRTYEEKAAEYLKQQGVRLIASNFRCRQGEIDLIGLHENCLVFFEVKYRKDGRCGMPEEAVGVSKQRKICRTSDYFRVSNKQYQHMQVRFDVIAVLGEEITWHKNAFPYQGAAMGW